MTMHYYFMLASTVMLVIIGGFVTIKFVKPKFEKQKYIIPSDINVSEFAVSDKEKEHCGGRVRDFDSTCSSGIAWIRTAFVIR